ncbi:MAG TPA: glycosyltransferase family 2 protein [Bacteroidales bacterium]|nr:glycosyltransferase family 2 protein [Bacteroidales bacterium]HPS50611.1 glycosyltransferase family 2 protein [Bacteroidales bacterium]
MKISVITVCHNSEPHIAKAITSVLVQSHPDLEYILIDGGSTDRTPEIIRSFGDRINRVFSGPDKGLYDAMNKGLRMASGEVAGFLHSDDFFVNETVIAKIARIFEQTGTDAVYGDIRYVDRNDSGRILTNRTAGTFRRWKLKMGWHPPHPAFYVKRDLLIRYGGFDDSFTISGDYDLMLRLLAVHRIHCCYLPEVLVMMRVGGISNRSMSNIRKKWKEDHRAMKKNHFGSILTLFLKSMRPVLHFRKSPGYLFE